MSMLYSNGDGCCLLHSKEIIQGISYMITYEINNESDICSQISVLFLVYFKYKSVQYCSYGESVKICNNSKSATFSFENGNITIFVESLKTHCGSNDD